MHAEIGLSHVALILSLAFLGGLFLQRLRQPALVGYILVGALIGPGLFGLQGEDASVKWLAELAVVLLMFMIGLELDVARFRKFMSVALIVTASQIALSLFAMFALSHFFFTGARRRPSSSASWSRYPLLPWRSRYCVSSGRAPPLPAA